MQLLGFPPRAAVAVFAEMFHHQAHVFEVTDTRLWVPKPETLRMAAHQGRRAFTQLRRGRRGRRQLAQFIVFGRHTQKLREVENWSKSPVAGPLGSPRINVRGGGSAR